MSSSEQAVCVVGDGHSSLGRAVVRALSERPGRLTCVGFDDALDVTDEWAVGSFFEAIGTVDHVVLVTAAATTGSDGRAADHAAARAAFDAAFWGALTVACEAGRHLRPGGSLTLTAISPGGDAGANGFAGSVLSAALVAAAKCLARDLAPLRVNVVGVDADGRNEDAVRACLRAIEDPSLTGAVLSLRARGDRPTETVRLPCARGCARGCARQCAAASLT
jgi:hypothetical protein